MKFEELPDIPESWLQFLRGGMPSLPAPESMSSLVKRAEAARGGPAGHDALWRRLEKNGVPFFDRTREHFKKLGQPDSAVILTNLYPALFGGPAFQFYKCLTAIKLCEELAGQNIQAVPVCWIRDESSCAFSQWSVRLLNHESAFCRLSLEPQDQDSPLPPATMATLIAEIEKSANGDIDPETLEILRSAFGQERTLAGAFAQLVAAMMQKWGMIVLDPRAFDFDEAGPVPALSRNAPYVAQSALLPVVATVVDPFEVELFAAAQPVFRELGLPSPVAWPQASATVVDSRSRRILQRHRLALSRLYAGADKVAGEILGPAPPGVSEKLLKLKQEAENRIAALGPLDPDGGGFARAAESGSEKIVYQLDRLRENFESARKSREETVRRQARRVCNSLAPDGRLQEREIGGIQLPLRYSPSILQFLHDKLDIASFEHQLIFMD